MTTDKKNLVIVESPAKAKTLARILGKDYRLEASMGHIRDLPKSSLGVDIEKDFKPKYTILSDKRKVIAMLKKAASESSMVYLATDPDREGEAIAWHLTHITGLEPDLYKRVVFHEITAPAIEQAFKKPRSLDLNLINAQQSRRVLDRLVGYKLSPLLWKKVQKGLSAGRVQSVAVRIIVDRENEIEKFQPREYWVIEVMLTKQAPDKRPPFKATLTGIPGTSKLEVSSKEQAGDIKLELEKSTYHVLQVKIKNAKRQPAPPFITSTLQQEASRRFRFSAKQTMVIAQQLYEGLPLGKEGNTGLITYMRTDSTHVSAQSIEETRSYIAEHYGNDYVPTRPRVFHTAVKGAQEAHEAIRPTSVERTPEAVKSYLNASQHKLYQLIWQRMVASQMAAATFENTTVEIEAKAPSKNKYFLRSYSSANVFPGFLALYSEAKDDDEEETTPALPPLEKAEPLDMKNILTDQRFTKPPSRYTEATLIKELEQKGIGRPSTYAPTISTIIDREYIEKEKMQLKPTALGTLVNSFLVEYFPEVVEVEFTANMEDKLDKVASGDADWTKVVAEFYAPLSEKLEVAEQKAQKIKPPAQPTNEVCPNCGEPLVIKVGRFGKYLSHDEYPEVNSKDCKYTSSYQLKTGVKCPECNQGEIVEKWNSKKKHAFYGCSRYPECKLATNYKPVAKSCPECGGLMSQYRIKWARCTKCSHKEKYEE
ncbi:MAG: type I DNA topoisomerase [Dehalococcoidales bacterium]|jgi:DNA topoisomerase-1|nr:type I DNA topoisomerase [Dehalococcoidales bacterium]MDX9986601.1 type I DNA topoisomerase [Dehalococcoidales bacterium]